MTFVGARGAGAIVLAVIAVSSSAQADPQASVAMTTAGGAAHLRAGADPKAEVQLGLRASVLFLRARESDMAIGPYAAFSVDALESSALGGGAEWLIPASPFPVVLSAGGRARDLPGGGWTPEGVARVFVGSRSYNFDSWYGLSGGLFVEGAYGSANGDGASVVAGLQLDVAILALPFVAAYEAVKR